MKIPDITLKSVSENYQVVLIDGIERGSIWRFLGTWRSCAIYDTAKGFEDPMMAAVDEYYNLKKERKCL